MSKFRPGLIFLLLFCFHALSAQDTPIALTNPSFEDVPQHSKPPKGWFDCGPATETPPDVHPTGMFGVTAIPSNGNTYLGMVVRNDDTWESVSQRLKQTLVKGQCYKMEIDLMRSSMYVSHNRKTGKKENYTNPIKLRIWGGATACEKRELLTETSLVDNTDWKTYLLKFTPARGNYKYLIFEAFYKTPILIPYNGNILMDNCSAIVTCPEEIPEKLEPKEEPLAVATKPKPTPNVPPAKKEKPKTTETAPIAVKKNPSPKPTEVKPKLMEELKEENMKEGQVFEVKHLYFEENSVDITDVSMPVLDEISQFLVKNDKIKIEVGGHTNNWCDTDYCNKLSKSRAKSVAEYLVEKGVDGSRVYYKGYGKEKPISSNKTAQGRAKNQRVELTILSITG